MPSVVRATAGAEFQVLLVDFPEALAFDLVQGQLEVAQAANRLPARARSVTCAHRHAR